MISGTTHCKKALLPKGKSVFFNKSIVNLIESIDKVKKICYYNYKNITEVNFA
jgi:hypothetical protein